MLPRNMSLSTEINLYRSLFLYFWDNQYNAAEIKTIPFLRLYLQVFIFGWRASFEEVQHVGTRKQKIIECHVGLKF